jgi:DNA-binding NarL/FixJ family response regulator
MNVLIIDDHPLLLHILSEVARAAFGAETEVRTAGTLEEGLATAQPGSAPDMVLLDLGLPGCSGVESLARCKEALPDVPIVVVSACEDRATIVAALKGGAAGYVPKSAAARQTAVAALKLVAAGLIYIPPQALEEGLPAEAPAGLKLTDRQLEVLRLVAHGLTNKQVAKRLKIAEDTVKQHLRAAFDALGIASRTQVREALARRSVKVR